MVFTPTGFSKQIFEERYAITGESWDDFAYRVSSYVASAERDSKKKLYADKFYQMIVNNYFIAGGRVNYGAGRHGCLLNCFLGSDQMDSKEGWAKTAYDMIKISMSGGGLGLDFSDIRPSGSSIGNNGGTCPGPVSLMELVNNIGEPVRSGGGRRVALLFSLDLDHPDIMKFLSHKLEKGKLELANVSVRSKNTTKFIKAVKSDDDWELVYKGKSFGHVKARDLWGTIVKNAYETAEPGFLNMELIEHENNISYRENMVSTNPCLTGDTLVYLADGRDQLSIKQLADEGKDVKVFCFNDRGTIDIRTMRNPRVTGTNVPIYKVTLDDGSEIKTTANHKFLLKSGEYKEVKDLKDGDSLRVLTKYRASIKDIFPEANSKSQDYWWLNTGKTQSFAEHRVIASNEINRKLKRGEVVHHKDYNSLNNDPKNLEVMTKKEHDRIHAENMVGDKNPMRRAKTEWSEEKWESYKAKQSKKSKGEGNPTYCDVSNGELRDLALEFTKKLGRRFSTNEWVEYASANGLPQNFSKFRVAELGSIADLAKWCEAKLGFIEFKDCHVFTIKCFNRLTDMGYNCVIQEGKVFVGKYCEHCGNKFLVSRKYREVSFCSKLCHAQYRWNDEDYRKQVLSSMQEVRNKKRGNLREVHISIYNELKFNLKRVPMKKEWVKLCKEKGVSPEISRKSSPFTSYKELQEAASMSNHKVVKVEFCGYETVYNGTVDDYHNFFIGGFESETKNGKRKLVYINNLQCGEICMGPYSCCCLGHVVLPRFVDTEGNTNLHLLAETIRHGVRFLDNVLTINNYPLPEIKIKSENERRIGLGTTGLGDYLILKGLRYGSKEALEETDKLYRFISKIAYEASVMLAIEKGSFPWFDADGFLSSGYMKRQTKKVRALVKEHGIRNSFILTNAPTGTVSIVSDNCSSGLEPVFAPAYTRKFWQGDKRATEVVVHPLFKKFYEEGKNLDHFIAAHELTVEQHLQVQATIQTHIDQSISKTINIPSDYPIEDMSKIWLKYLPDLKGTTFYRESTRGYYNKDTGQFEEPPLTPLSLQDAIKELKNTSSVTVGVNGTIDCAKGSCDVR